MDFKAEKFSFELITNSVLGSNEVAKLGFRGAHGGSDYAGGLSILFSDPAKYFLSNCISPDRAATFPTKIPTVANKVWRVMLARNSTESRVVVFCNGIEVLNVVLSETTCRDGGTEWKSGYWKKDVKKIRFHKADTASDFYRIASSGEVMIYSTVEFEVDFLTCIYFLENTPNLQKCHVKLGDVGNVCDKLKNE